MIENWAIQEYFEKTDKTKLGIPITHSKLNYSKKVFKIQIGMFIVELHPDHIRIEDDMNLGSNGNVQLNRSFMVICMMKS